MVGPKILVTYPGLQPMLKRIFQAFRSTPDPKPAFSIDLELLTLLEQLAVEEQRAVEEIIGELLWTAVADRYTAVENLQPWQELTPREKQAAALACLGYTNHEIAEHMVISTNTVKTHLRHVLRKFNVCSKRELREVLTGWDFAGWIEQEELWSNGAPNASNSVSSGGITP